MQPLADRHFEAPGSDRSKLVRGPALEELQAQLAAGWEVVEEHHLTKEFKFGDFQRALDFTNRVGALVEELDHHPEICTSWGRTRITIRTHGIGGLGEADFIFAARCERLAEG